MVPPHGDPGGSGARHARHRTTVVVLGSVITIDTAEARWAARLRRLLAPFVVTSPAGRAPPTRALEVLDAGAGRDDDVSLVDGPVVLARAPWPSIEARLLVEVNATAIGGYAGLAVHAGVVARGDEAICFPGESGLGKSTMTGACLGAGFDYVSDEALCLDLGDGAVEPYPRPIALSRTSLALLGAEPRATAACGPTAGPASVDDDPGGDDREVVVLADELGARAVAPDRRLRLAHVVALRRGATEVHLEPLVRAQAVPILLSMAFNHFKEPDASVEVIAELARGVGVWRLHHDDPVEAAALLARTFT